MADAPNDVLERLKREVGRFRPASAGHHMIGIDLIRDIVAEIERLRETVRVVVSSEQRAETQTPKPERWEAIGEIFAADAGPLIVCKADSAAQPFGVTEWGDGLVKIWFQRRVVT